VKLKASSRSRTKNEMVGEFRRHEILTAARSVFARKGFALGIMDEIAREAGIAKGTIYLYFRSKTEVYKALLDHDMKLLQVSTLERMDRAVTLKDKIHAFLQVRLENAENKREIFRIMDSERANLHMTRKQYRDFLHEPVARLAAAIDVAAAAGTIRPMDGEKTAWLIADVARGAIQRRLLSAHPAPSAEDAAFLLDFLWTSLEARKQ
jgi:TetR/AcrR family transcriptional regulator of autoinduction and epiphytic fitness